MLSVTAPRLRPDHDVHACWRAIMTGLIDLSAKPAHVPLVITSQVFPDIAQEDTAQGLPHALILHQESMLRHETAMHTRIQDLLGYLHAACTGTAVAELVSLTKKKSPENLLLDLFRIHASFESCKHCSL